MHILLKYPSRQRPKLFRETIEKWSKSASGLHHLQWLVSADDNDPEMCCDEIRAFCAERGIAIHYARNKTKIQAVNANMHEAGPAWQTLIVVSDDMEPVANAWDDIVAQAMPSHLDAGLWFHDGRQDRICTLSIMGRPVYERFGHIYDPRFKSLYCDELYTRLLMDEGKMIKVPGTVFCHSWLVQNHDDLMRRNEATYIRREDKETYHRILAELGLSLPV